MDALHRARLPLHGALALAALGALLAAGTNAEAQTPSSLGAMIPGGTPPSSGLDALQTQPYWDIGASRPFVAVTLDAGFLYVRPQLAIGYGKPFRSWAGVEMFPGLAAGGVTQYAGIRLALPQVELRAGARYVVTFGRHFVPVRTSYGRDDIDTERGERSRYLSLDGELTGSVRAPLGSIFGVLTGFAIVGVPRGQRVFEEALHQVVEPPFVWRGRLGYVIQLGTDGEISAGLFGEIIHIPGRGAIIGRGGPVAGLQISDHLDLLASVAFVLASPDRLGLIGGDIAQLGIRYRWATGEPAPFVPWRLP